MLSEPATRGPLVSFLWTCPYLCFDGFEATKRIRAIEEQMAWPPAKIVVLSAYGTGESRKKAMASGCDLFVADPASPKKIKETVQLLVG